jgi:hypothetical protein
MRLRTDGLHRVDGAASGDSTLENRFSTPRLSRRRDAATAGGRERANVTTSPTDPKTDAIAAERAEARRLVVSGMVIGGLDLLALGALGVSCPLCAVGAPALVGWGAYRWFRARRACAETPP